MPFSQSQQRQTFESVRSRLGASLLRLYRCIEKTKRDEERVETMFTAWQQRWSTRREQITRRLQFIESQLENLEKQSTDASPKLAVIGVPDDADEMTCMGPF